MPWIHLHARADGAVLPCCVAEESGAAGSLRTDGIAALFNAKPMRRLRLDMLARVRNPVCWRCYAIDDAGGRSLRQVYNSDFSHRLPEAQRTSADGAVDPSRIAYLDIRFSNLCNLRCRSCGSHSSTAWYQDDPATAPDDFRILRPGVSPERLWEQIESLLPGVERIHFAGGEPMLMDETYRTLEKLLDLGRTDVRLSFNTNVTTWTHRQWDAVELWKGFPNIFIMASLDGAGPRGEYIRKGLKWSEAVENCRRVRREAPHAEIEVNFTLGLLNALHLPDFLDEVAAVGLFDADDVMLNFIQEPVYLSLTSLPPAVKLRVRELYEQAALHPSRRGSKGLMEGRLLEALGFMESRDTSAELAEFRRRTRALDAKRRESFTSTFPELAELMPPV